MSYGQNADDIDWQSLDIDNPASQREWPVTRVRQNGDTVTWIGRARLGTETAPHHSQWFVGYRVTYSDGHTVDTTEQSHTRAGATVVSVEPVNSITGVSA